MNLVIFKRKSTGSKERAFKPTIDDDMEVLWQGEDFEQFEKETGIKESEIGGLEKVNGKLQFNQSVKDNHEKLKLPIATGKGLIAFMENYRSTLARKEVKTLLSSLEPFFRLLNQSRCNPLLLAELDEEILELKLSLSAKEYKIVTTVINEWKNTVRFV